MNEPETEASEIRLGNEREVAESRFREVAIEYLGLDDNYSRLDEIINQSAKDFVGLRVESQVLDDSAEMTLFMGIEEKYLYEKEVGDPREARKNRLARLDLLLGKEGVRTRTPRMRIYQDGAFHKESSDRFWDRSSMIDEYADESASNSLRKGLLDDSRALNPLLENLNIDKEALASAIKDVKIVVTSLSKDEFLERYGSDAAVFKYPSGETTMVFSKDSHSYENLLRHEVAHLLQGKLAIGTNYLVDKSLSEVLTEGFANGRINEMPDLPPEIAFESEMYYEQARELVRELHHLMKGGKIEADDLVNLYKKGDLSSFDKAICQSYGLAGRMMIGLMRCSADGDRVPSMFSPKEVGRALTLIRTQGIDYKEALQLWGGFEESVSSSLEVEMWKYKDKPLELVIFGKGSTIEDRLVVIHHEGRRLVVKTDGKMSVLVNGGIGVKTKRRHVLFIKDQLAEAIENGDENESYYKDLLGKFQDEHGEFLD